MLHDYHSRPFATSRRRAWPRILGWIVAVIPFALLMLMTFNIEWLLQLFRR
jgi:hypothetical protein